MANAFFDAYKSETYGDAAGPGHGTVDWEADTIHAALIDAGTVDPAITTHQDWADLVSAVIGTTTAIASKTAVPAASVMTLDGGNMTYTAVSGASVEDVVVYKNSGSDATSLLIIDYDTATGLPVTPNGGDITVTWAGTGLATF